MALNVGVLALQGAVAEHARALAECGVRVTLVKRSDQLKGLSALVIPGGESTTIGKLMHRYAIDDAICGAVASGMALFGTCTGLILMAREIQGSEQGRLGLLDMEVDRNAYGRQVDSFEADLPVPDIGEPSFPAVFIRAPRVVRLWGDAQAIAHYDGSPVLVRQGRLLAASFHPELKGDLRIHRYFLSMLD